MWPWCVSYYAKPLRSPVSNLAVIALDIGPHRFLGTLAKSDIGIFDSDVLGEIFDLLRRFTDTCVRMG